MDALGNLAHGFQVALTPENLAWALIGVLLGTAVGVLPGIGPALTVALLLPVTYRLEPISAFIMFAGIYYGGMYGGSTTSILLNTPGESASIVTALEGNQMAKRGRGAAALATAAIGSFVAGTVGTIGLTFLAPVMVDIGLRFGPAEYFALVVLAFTTITALLGSSVARGFLSLFLGLALGLVGIDTLSGQSRFTFGIPQLLDGIDVVTVAVGLFAVGETFWVASRMRHDPDQIIPVRGKVWMTAQEWARSWKPWLRGTALGFPIGSLPAGGAEIPTFLSYALEKRLTKHPEEFGQGAIEGVAGPEAANNASAAGVLAPLLTLGLPTSATAAILLAAFQRYGLNPGPTLFRSDPDLVWGLIASLYIGNVMLLVLNLPLAPMWVRLLAIPRPLLYAAILVFAGLGTYGISGSTVDLVVLYLLGALGFVMRRFDIPVAPAVVGMVLGPIAEDHFRRALQIAQGNYTTFVTRPISAFILLLALLALVAPPLFRWWQGRRARLEELRRRQTETSEVNAISVQTTDAEHGDMGDDATSAPSVGSARDRDFAEAGMVDLDIPLHMHGIAPDSVDPRLRQTPEPPWQPGEKRRYVVQFVHSLFEEEREELQQRFGLELEAYIPKYAYVEQVSEQTVADLSQHPLVNGLFPLGPGYKEAPGIGQNPFKGADPEGAQPFRLWAILFSNLDLDVVAEKLRDIDATDIVVHDDTGALGDARIAFSVETLARIPEITALEEVDWVQEIPVISPNGGIPSGWMQTGSMAAPITGAGLCGNDQIVGIMDIGLLNANHCWFQNKVIASHGTDHGTVPNHAVFVAGILCGNDLTNPARRGIAHEAKIAYANWEDFQNTGTLYTYLNMIRRNDASVINASWHSNLIPHYNQDSVDTDRFMWNYEQRLIVGSAGNTGDVMGPPGSAKNALCVGAAYVDENVSCLADVGAGTEVIVQEATGIIEALGTVEGGRRKPDLLAPGCDIDSANTATPCDIISAVGLHAGAASPGNPACDPGGAFCATSYATPVVSAAAAIVRQYFRQGWYATGAQGGAPSRTPTAALIKAMLLNATEQVTDPSGNGYPIIREGWGLLRLDRVIRLAGEPKKIEFWDFPKARGFFRGGSRDHTVTINSNTQHLKVTLVWTEPAGNLKATDPVVNNLDLVATSESGARYVGNWFHNGQSAVDTPLQPGVADPANNVEMVLVKQPEPGDWTITVTATEVNAGRTGQGYALVVRGDLA